MDCCPTEDQVKQLGESLGRTRVSRVAWRLENANADVASVRIRCLGPMRALSEMGVDTELFKESKMGDYDAVVFSKYYKPAAYSEALRLKDHGAKVVFDLCDNHFYNPRKLPEWERSRDHLIRMIELADHIVCSTDALADVVRNECEVNVGLSVIGDGFEECAEPAYIGLRSTLPYLNFKLLQRSISASCGRPLVWFGNHGSPYADGGMSDLLRVKDVLERLSREIPVQLTVVSNNKKKYVEHIKPWSIPTHYIPWNRYNFSRVLRMHDLAILPIGTNPFTQCKTSNRVTTALMHGLGVVADEIPSYTEFERFIVLNDWIEGLKDSLKHPVSRGNKVAEGRRYIRRNMTMGRVVDGWLHVFDELMNP